MWWIFSTIYKTVWLLKLSLWARRWQNPCNASMNSPSAANVIHWPLLIGLYGLWTLHIILSDDVRCQSFQPQRGRSCWQIVKMCERLTWRLRRSGEYGSVSGSPWFCPRGWAEEMRGRRCECRDKHLITCILQTFGQMSVSGGGKDGCTLEPPLCEKHLVMSETTGNIRETLLSTGCNTKLHLC